MKVVISSLAFLLLVFSGCGSNNNCTPDCTGKVCGPDGCGGTCSPGCGAGETCNEATGQCESGCVPACTGKCCGDDGCEGTCPDNCEDTGQTCNTTTCVCEGSCEPDCNGKECGPDGCGSTCPPGCSAGEQCNETTGQCEGSNLSITAVEPTQGYMLSSTSVRITGSGFASGATIMFGDSQATDVVLTSPEIIDCQAPPGNSGLVDVIVANTDTQEGILSNGFTYYHNALVFDGNDDGLVVETFPNITGPFTVEIWVKPGSSGGGINPRLVELVGSNDTSFRLGMAENQAGVTRRRVNFELYIPARQDAMSDQYLDPGQWYHIAAVYNGTQQILYIDGEVASSRSATGTPRSNSVLDIGTGTGDNDCLDGTLDEIRIWNVGRTQAEIIDSMHRALTGNEQGLIAYWNLDEGTGQVARDISINGLDAKLGTSVNADQCDPGWTVSEVLLDLP